MTEKMLKTLSTEFLENLTGLYVFTEKQEMNGEDFIDDMCAHIIICGFRFCVDIEKENDLELKKARKFVENLLSENNIKW